MLRSLVGSEMCIRDSILNPPPSGNKATANPWETVVRSDLGHIQEQTVMPAPQANKVKTYVSGSPWDTVVGDNNRATNQQQQQQNSVAYQGNSVKTYMKPTTSDNIAELKNYMEYQKLAPAVSKKMNVNNAVKNQKIPSKDPNESKSKMKVFIYLY